MPAHPRHKAWLDGRVLDPEHATGHDPAALQHATGAGGRVAAQLNDLTPEDVALELVLRRGLPSGATEWPACSSFNANDASGYRVLQRFAATGERDSDGSHVFEVDCAPPWCGRLNAEVRIVPRHPLLTHPYEMGLMKWL
jgi:starch phosphorylase